MWYNLPMLEDFQNLKQIISSDTSPLEDKLEAILQLSMNSDPESRDYLDSLLKHKEVRIRYFIKKIIHKELQWKEKLLSRGKENISSGLAEEDAKTGPIKAKQNPELVEKHQEEEPEEGKGTFSFSRMYAAAGIGILILILFVSYFLSGSGNATKEVPEDEDMAVSIPGNLSLEELQRKGQEEFSLGHEKEAFAFYFKMYNQFGHMIDARMDKENIRSMSCFSLEFFKQNMARIEKLDTSFFRYALEMIYCIRYLSSCEESMEQSLIRKSVKLLSDDPTLLLFLHQDLLKLLAEKTNRMNNANNRHYAYCLMALYQKRPVEARAVIEASAFNQQNRDVLDNIIKKYDALPDTLKSDPTNQSISKPMFSNHYFLALALSDTDRVMVSYMKAFIDNPLVVQFFDRKFFRARAADYMTFLRKKNVPEIKKLLAAFCYAVYFRKKKALEILDDNWTEEESRTLADSLKGILAGQTHYFPIPDKIPEKISLSELHGFLYRKSKTEGERPASQAQKNPAENTDALLDRIDDLMQAQKYSDAVAELRKNAASSPADPVPLLMMGDIYVRMGQDGDAMEAYEDALRRQPDITALRETLAMKYEEAGNIKKAKLHYGLLSVYSSLKTTKDMCMKKMFELGKLPAHEKK